MALYVIYADLLFRDANLALGHLAAATVVYIINYKSIIPA